MGDHPHVIHTIRIVCAGALLVVISILLSLVSSVAQSTNHQLQTKQAHALGTPGSSNVIANGTLSFGIGFTSAVVTVSSTITGAASAAGSFIAEGGRTVGSAVWGATKATGRGIGGAITFTANIVGKSVVFVVTLPAHIGSSLSDASMLNAVIRPSDSIEVPIIDPNSPELQSALAALPPKEGALIGPENVTGQGPLWPAHGRVTTEFGVPHRPYQVTHSGIDIADGSRPGTTPVRPFRPGRVIDVQHSNRGLGNHVVVEHGNGVTSVYAHLDSIAVNVAQEVALDTDLGRMGTTGVSTGTHLHFEIRVHNQAADPRQFITGQP